MSSAIASMAVVAVVAIPLLSGKFHEGMSKMAIESWEPRIHFSHRGRFSTFGGPADATMSRSEVLALFENRAEAGHPSVREYFLWPPPPGISGTLRQLDPQKFYVACRWDYSKASKKLLRQSFVTVTNPANGRSTQAKPVDWGPAASTGRAVDMSPGLAAFLGVQVNDEVIVTFETEP
ncbi:hypothetical protein [Prosthecobacter sp.]|uniref:hypothetical protein n=1 Tax=Prosthecobacter sp. TaxID=1965333 RepID=UPI002AB90A08|nr:hypothetical protein [Prosthecobacter sp.]MDZ4403423.1 hypothetical protein [Prosthecobacter sp.]